jgi:murein DD-endopeptidase MepM/ murein hydrolase activator NlpD
MSVGLDPSQLAANAQTGLDVQNKLRMDSLARTLNAGNTDEKKLVEACRGFESAFLQKLMAQMRATVPKDGLLHGQYEDQYVSMFDQAFADKMAEAGGIGLADMMLSQLRAKVGKGQDGAAKSGQPGQVVDAGAVAHAQASVGATLPANRPVNPSGARLGSGLDHVPVTSGPSAKAPQRIVHDPVLAHPSHALFLSQSDAAGDASRPGREQAARELTAPVTGTITSDYGWRSDPFTGRAAWHAGMDIAAASGEPVAACWDGQVVFAGQKGGYGNAVVVEHEGGWRSVYGHLSHIDVREGDRVAAGRKIAEVGSTGRSTGPHLHFELRYTGASVDPLQAGIYAANTVSPDENAGPARLARQSGGTVHALENHRQPGEAGEGPDASGHAAGGRIYPPAGA